VEKCKRTCWSLYNLLKYFTFSAIIVHYLYSLFSITNDYFLQSPSSYDSVNNISLKELSLTYRVGLLNVNPVLKVDPLNIATVDCCSFSSFFLIRSTCSPRRVEGKSVAKKAAVFPVH